MSKSSTITEAPTVTLKQANVLVKAAMRARRPVFLWGPMGIGKSDLVRAIGRELDNAPVVDLRMALLDPTDVRGIGFYNPAKNAMDWAPPVDLPSEEFAKEHKYVILFLDEMNSAPPAVQAAAYQLVLDRKVGVYSLPDNVLIVAAGNRDTDKGVTNRMPAPLANRFVHFEVRHDFDSWFEWAVEHNQHPDVVGYLQANKADLFNFNRNAPSHEQRSFATPRSWAFASDFLWDAQNSNMSDEDLNMLITGTLGGGIAFKLKGHRAYASKLPRVEDILDGRNPALEVDEMSARWSLITNLCYQLKENYQALSSTSGDAEDYKKWVKQFDIFLRYMLDHFKPEMIIIAMRMALVQYRMKVSHQKLTNWPEFHQKYGRYLAS